MMMIVYIYAQHEGISRNNTLNVKQTQAVIQNTSVFTSIMLSTHVHAVTCFDSPIPNHCYMNLC